MKFVTIGFYKIITEPFNLFVGVLTEATAIWFIFISITCGIAFVNFQKLISYVNVNK